MLLQALFSIAMLTVFKLIYWCILLLYFSLLYYVWLEKNSSLYLWEYFWIKEIWYLLQFKTKQNFRSKKFEMRRKFKNSWTQIHFLSNQIPWNWNNGISFTWGNTRRRHMKFSKNCFWLFATQIEGCLNNLSDCTFKNSIWMTVTYKSPKLGLDPLYL